MPLSIAISRRLVGIKMTQVHIKHLLKERPEELQSHSESAVIENEPCN